MDVSQRIARLGCVALLWAGAANAALYTVGNAPPGPNLPQGDFTCSYDTIQAAIDAAAATPNAPDEVDVIRVSYTGDYAAQQLSIGSIDLEISGGYHDCWAAQQGWYEPTRQTTISGAGGAAAPVIRVRGSGVRTFRSLFITRGDHGGDGGGIDYQGIGTIVLVDTAIGANTAGRGGGIYARASGGPALVEIGSNVQLIGNVANSGGGVYVAGDTRIEMLGDHASLFFNRATGEGGGLFVEGPGYARIGSPGWGGVAAIDSNRAADGAGIAAIATSAQPNFHRLVDLVSTDPLRPIRVADNVASFRGGALYARGHDEFLSANSREAEVGMVDFVLEGNSAPHGGAIYLDNESGGTEDYGARVLIATSHPPSVACSAPSRCNRIEHNRGTATDGGSIIRVDPASAVEARRVTLAFNEATHLVWTRGNGDTTVADFGDCAMYGNDMLGALLRGSGDRDLWYLHRCTIASNTVGGDVVLAENANTYVDLRSSVFDQPENVLLAHPGGPSDDDIATRNNVGFGVEGLSATDHNSLAAPPRFVDPAFGDFRLRPGSAAIDHGEPVDGDQADLDRTLRDKDFALKPDVAGTRDIGAFEFQPRANLAVNGDFANDLRAWVVPEPSHVVLDAFDLSGSYGLPGKNSVRVQVAAGGATDVVALRQCLHLPAPGHYRIRAHALTKSVLSDFEDVPTLEWSYLPNAGESCEGAASASGATGFRPAPSDDLLVWREQATIPVVTVAPPAQPSGWTPNAAIEIRLRVAKHPDQGTEHNLYALFDGVEVTHSTMPPPPTELLSDGFE